MFLRKNVASQVFTLPGTLRNISDGSAVTSGASLTWVTDGTSTAAAGTLTHISDGAYKYQPTQSETNANICGFVLSKTGAVGLAGSVRTTGSDPSDAVRLGLTAMPNIASGNAGAILVDGTGTAAISNSGGKVLLQATQTGVTIPTVTTVGSVSGAVASVTAQVTANVTQWGGVNVTGMPMPTYTQPTGFLSATFPSAVSSYAGGAVASVTGAVGSVTSAVTVTGTVTANVVSINSVTVNGAGTSGNPWGP